MKYYPPFKITSKILTLSHKIGHELGLLKGAKLSPPSIELRRKNMIQTIQASLAIEGNMLNEKQITSIINAKRVLAPKKDLIEVKNAIKVYSKLHTWNPLDIQNFKKAHALLMKNLLDAVGEWRTTGVGIFKKQKVAHIAPPAKRVAGLMENLFNFLKIDKETSWLLKACIFHYEMEFIHPFLDGNGRMGRLWQQLLLMRENQIFGHIPVEFIIKQNQEQYYESLGICDQNGESTVFIEFSLEQILITLKMYTETITSQINTVAERLNYAKEYLKDWFTRKDYIILHKDISSATASRDLKEGIKKNVLFKMGELNQVKYKFIL
jgi:Fic family protein